MLLVLWAFESSRAANKVFQKVDGPGGELGIPFSRGRTIRTRLFQDTRGAVCTSLLTTGFPKAYGHSGNFGEPRIQQMRPCDRRSDALAKRRFARQRMRKKKIIRKRK